MVVKCDEKEVEDVKKILQRCGKRGKKRRE